MMDALKYPGSINGFEFDHKSVSGFPEGSKLGHPISDHVHELAVIPNDSNRNNPGQSSGLSSDLDTCPEDVILKYISQMLMEEEDLEHRPSMFQDCLALQATEKSFYDALGENLPPSSQNPSFVPDQNSDSPNDIFAVSSSSPSSNSSTGLDTSIEPDCFLDGENFESSFTQSSHVDYNFDSVLESFGSSNTFSLGGPVNYLVTPFRIRDSNSESQLVSQLKNEDSKFSLYEMNEKNSRKVVEAKKNGRGDSPNGSVGKKNPYREDSEGVVGGRINKQLASFNEQYDEESEMHDEVLLCPPMNPLHPDYVYCGNDGSSENAQSKGSNRGRRRGKRQGNQKEVVDLTTQLTQCAQAVASSDVRSANELLSRIKQHSSPSGDGIERLAHFFANALKARLAGAGTAPYTSYVSTGISAAGILKGYQLLIKACPFHLLSNLFANRSIRKLSSKATRLHIIDFGIIYGFQWPCLIQQLSARPGGPPKLRITGIEFPQPGFRPAERVEETGRRLAKYCERFNVPFEYNAIAKKWDAIQLEDLKIGRDELLVVNSLYRLRYVSDDMVVVSSPRDMVLKLIKSINPDLFVHGVLNGTYNAPFFVTRFREALFHFSTLFDIFDATVSREDQIRMLFEEEIYGKDVMNVVACEGTNRFDRPESYKQWQVRNVRAGFRQLPLDPEVVQDVRAMVKKGYHKDFVVDEDGNWMLQGWKGRIIFAVSCWKPAKDF